MKVLLNRNFYMMLKMQILLLILHVLPSKMFDFYDTCLKIPVLKHYLQTVADVTSSYYEWSAGAFVVCLS